MSTSIQGLLFSTPEFILFKVLAKLTSIFGSVLKMDSTKKILKKLAGKNKGTAKWVTNVSNENGEVLATVLTQAEGKDLQPLCDGLMKRYKDAEVPPPILLYVDKDCCESGFTPAKNLFKGI